MIKTRNGKAHYIATLEDWQGIAKLYRVEPPVEYSDFDGYNYGSGDPVPRRTTNYVIVSAAITYDHGAETYIFPARRCGDSAEVTDWMEVDGSFEGELNHEQALNNAGYEVIQ